MSDHDDMCADCLLVEAKSLNRTERRHGLRACQTPGCVSWKKKNKNRRKPHSRAVAA